MTAIGGLSAALHEKFCADLDVTAVPAGYAVTTGFMMPDGDPLSFYLVVEGEGQYRLEDDGTFLPNAIAAGLDLKSSVRDALLRGILAEEGAHYDNDYAIRTAVIPEAEVGAAAMKFVSALIRLRDLSLLSRENVAASFAEDVKRALSPALPNYIEIDEEATQDPFSADIVLRRKETGLKAARVFAAGNDLRMMDALVQHQNSQASESPVIAVVDRRKGHVSEKRFNNATNLGLRMAVVDGTDEGWVRRVLELADPANDPPPRSRVS